MQNFDKVRSAVKNTWRVYWLPWNGTCVPRLRGTQIPCCGLRFGFNEKFGFCLLCSVQIQIIDLCPAFLNATTLADYSRWPFMQAFLSQSVAIGNDFLERCFDFVMSMQARGSVYPAGLRSPRYWKVLRECSCCWCVNSSRCNDFRAFSVRTCFTKSKKGMSRRSEA